MEKQKGLKQAVIEKFLENIMSAKMWLFFIASFIMTFIGVWIIYNNFELIFHVIKQTMQSDSYIYVVEMSRIIKDVFIGLCMSITGLVGSIVVVREVFKVQKLRSLNNEEKENTEEIKRMDI